MRGRVTNRLARASGSDRQVRALTLLEVVIAVALMVLILAAMFTFYWQMLDVRKQAGERSNRTQLARQVLAGIEAEIRGTVGFDQIGFPIETPETHEGDTETEVVSTGGGPVPRLIGDRRSINFLTTGLPAEHQYRFLGTLDEPPPAQHDLRWVSYSLWIDPNQKTEDDQPVVGGVVRTEKKTLNQVIVDEENPLELRQDLWAPEIGYLEFRYFDGVEWDTKWDITEGNSLPQLIQITVGYKNITSEEYEDQDLDSFPLDEYPFGDDLDHPDRYTVIVRVPAADKFFGSRVQKMGKKFAEQFGVEGAGLK